MLFGPNRFLLHDGTKIRVDGTPTGAYHFSVIFPDEITDMFDWYPDNKAVFKEAHRSEAVEVLQDLLKEDMNGQAKEYNRLSYYQIR